MRETMKNEKSTDMMLNTMHNDDLSIHRQVIHNILHYADLSIAMHVHRQLSPLIDKSRSVDLSKNYNVVTPTAFF